MNFFMQDTLIELFAFLSEVLSHFMALNFLRERFIIRKEWCAVGEVFSRSKNLNSCMQQRTRRSNGDSSIIVAAFHFNAYLLLSFVK